MMRNIMIDVAFSVVTNHPFEELTQAEILAAMTKRVAYLIENWEPEAFGFCDEYTVEE